uniref:Uncharacterized protein n=1 Tax=Arundo donax TaxID=35708 RepID=A0A0A9A4M0_ARUDO
MRGVVCGHGMVWPSPAACRACRAARCHD